MANPPFLSPGLAAAATNILAGGLGHTYTRTPNTYGARDVWSRRVTTPGAAVSGVRCRYISRVELRVTDAGYVMATEAPSSGGTLAFMQTLTALPDDPLAVGDTVTDIRDRAGAVLLAGPATVEAVLPHAGFGATTLKMFVLRGTEVERRG